MALSMQNELVQSQLENQNPALLKPERLKKIFETSRRQINWLTNLTNDVLNVSRIASGRIYLKIEQHDLLELAG